VSAKPFISFAGVQKSFKVEGRQFVAVRNVSLEVQRGEIITLVGPSGCGKSTLLNMTAGLFGPTEGQVHYDGVEVKGVNTRVGYMTQADHLLPWRTVAGNIAVPLQIRRLPKAQIDTRVEELMALVGLTGFGESYPNQLSGGMRKRAAMARLMASDPETLLMDEPFGALDAFTREQMQELLLQVWRRTAKPVFLITHDIEEAVFLATDLILLAPNPGQIVERLSLDFGQRYAAGESARAIKSDPRFIETREHVLGKVFSQRQVSA